jgi:plastocyanin
MSYVSQSRRYPEGLMRRRTFVSLGLTAVGALVVSCAGSAATSAPQNPQPAQPASANAPVPAGNVAAVAPAAVPTAAAPVAPTPAPTAVPAATTTIVKMTDDYKFNPASITIPKGTTVEWQGTGAQPHTVTDDPAKAMDKSHTVLPSGAEPWDSGLLNPGQSFKHTFTVAGDYAYICIPHEAMGMVGKITVTG